jgi:2-dehydro-3-deoxy-D-arabinonate dehydratase
MRGRYARQPSIELTVTGDGHAIFASETRTSRIKRPLRELVDYLRKELDFPGGVFLMTGTGIVPPDDFSLAGGDHVRITIGDSADLENEVARRWTSNASPAPPSISRPRAPGART